MTICGITVYHKKFGQGTISRCENKVLSVAFLNLDGIIQEKNFIFPDVFINKHLETLDPRVDEYIQKYFQERTCSVCGRENVSTKEICEKRLCKQCEEKLTRKCHQCGQINLNENFSSLHLSEYPHYITLCNDCYSHYVYRCDKCHTFFVSTSEVHTYSEKMYCDRCYDKLISTCPICGELYLDEHSNMFVNDGEYIQACPTCIQEKTFVCSECNLHVMNEELVNSKYVSAEKKICSRCVEHCSSCGEPIDTEHSCTYFSKTYCKDCEVSRKVACSICSEEFIPDKDVQHLCPDCMDSVAYIQNTKKLDFSCRYAKTMSVYDLDYVDRCRLFTNLYENCRSLNSGRDARNNDKPYHYLVMTIMGYKAIVTYLPREITTSVKHSANITMTELRSKKGRIKVYAAIERWLSESDHTMCIREGKVQLLHYPVLIRAQTEYDKVYGKEWNGPYDYIEIGNYGDTTDFYIIGVLK